MRSDSNDAFANRHAKGGQMITGRCHCGAAAWTYAGNPETATSCNCTVCRRYGALWGYDWLGDRISVSGETVPYVRGDRDIAFHHCATCGCIMWWQAVGPDADGRTRIAVNLRMADAPEKVAHLVLRRFDGCDTFEALPDATRRVSDMWF